MKSKQNLCRLLLSASCPRPPACCMMSATASVSMSSCASLVGSWTNELGSMMNIQSVYPLPCAHHLAICRCWPRMCCWLFPSACTYRARTRSLASLVALERRGRTLATAHGGITIAVASASGFSDEQVGAILLLYGMFVGIGVFISGRAIDRLSSQKVIIVCLVAMMLSYGA